MELDLKPNNFEMVDGMVGNWFVDFKRDHKVLLTDEKSVCMVNAVRVIHLGKAY